MELRLPYTQIEHISSAELRRKFITIIKPLHYSTSKMHVFTNIIMGTNGTDIQA